MGDASDNIPGVAGIGQTACDLVAKYGSIEEIYSKIDELEISFCKSKAYKRQGFGVFKL